MNAIPSPSAVLDWFKPPKTEAVARLRTNSLGLLTLTVVTNLLPLPSLWTAVSVIRNHAHVGALYYLLCLVEVMALALLSVNILQASYALRYPKAPYQPLHTPAKKDIPMSPPARQWHLKGLSPQSSPQKSFSYAASPISTPSRTINYTIPHTGDTSLDASFASSLASLPPSPSSPLAAYRGKHARATGRAFDGSLLRSLRRVDSDDDDDE